MFDSNPAERKRIQTEAALASIARILKIDSPQSVSMLMQISRGNLRKQIKDRLKFLNKFVSAMGRSNDRIVSNSDRQRHLRFYNDELQLLFKSAVDLGLLDAYDDFDDIFPQNPTTTPNHLPPFVQKKRNR